jgi:hypothetical protein
VALSPVYGVETEPTTDGVDPFGTGFGFPFSFFFLFLGGGVSTRKSIYRTKISFYIYSIPYLHFRRTFSLPLWIFQIRNQLLRWYANGTLFLPYHKGVTDKVAKLQRPPMENRPSIP